MLLLEQNHLQGNLLKGPYFRVQYRVPKPEDYPKVLDEVKLLGSRLFINSLLWTPLRLNYEGWTNSLEFDFYKSTIQRYGYFGTLAQLLGQPVCEVFDESFIVLSLEELGFTVSEKPCLQEVYERAFSLGLMGCPYAILPILSLCGFEAEYHKPVMVMTEAPLVKEDQTFLHVLYYLTNDGGKTGKTTNVCLDVEADLCSRCELLYDESIYKKHPIPTTHKFMFCLPAKQKTSPMSAVDGVGLQMGLETPLTASSTKMYLDNTEVDLASPFLLEMKRGFTCLR